MIFSSPIQTKKRRYSPPATASLLLYVFLLRNFFFVNTGNRYHEYDFQPWEFYVTEKSEVMEKLSKAGRYASPVAEAPLVIVLCYDKNKLLYPDFPLIDMACCAENIMVEAAGLGLGTVFLSIAPLPDRMKLVTTVLQLSDTIVPYVLIPPAILLRYTSRKTGMMQTGFIF